MHLNDLTTSKKSLDLNTGAADTAWSLVVGQVDSKRVIKRFVQLQPVFNQAGKKEYQRLLSFVFHDPFSAPVMIYK